MRVIKKELIRKHLEEYGEITSMDAFMSYGVTRLSAIIFNLRNEGYSIDSKPTTSKDRYGNNVTYATYILNNKGVM